MYELFVGRRFIVDSRNPIRGRQGPSFFSAPTTQGSSIVPHQSYLTVSAALAIPFVLDLKRIHAHDSWKYLKFAANLNRAVKQDPSDMPIGLSK